jgi:putative tricarboxylic transport membrane protein
MQRKDRFSAFFFLFFSGVTIYLAFKLPWGRISKPGPGVFPLVLSVVIGLLAFVLLLTTLRLNKESGAEEIPTTKWRLLYLLGDLCLYAFLFRSLGFLISTWIFLVALQPIVKKKWIPVLLGSMFISFCFLFFFSYLLKVELPMGILGK